MQHPPTGLCTVSTLLPEKTTAWEAARTHEESFEASQMESTCMLGSSARDLHRGVGQLPTAGLIEDCLDPMGMDFHDGGNFLVDDWSDIQALLGSQVPVCMGGDQEGTSSTSSRTMETDLLQLPEPHSARGSGAATSAFTTTSQGHEPGGPSGRITKDEAWGGQGGDNPLSTPGVEDITEKLHQSIALGRKPKGITEAIPPPEGLSEKQRYAWAMGMHIAALLKGGGDGEVSAEELLGKAFEVRREAYEEPSPPGQNVLPPSVLEALQREGLSQLANQGVVTEASGQAGGAFYLRVKRVKRKSPANLVVPLPSSQAPVLHPTPQPPLPSPFCIQPPVGRDSGMPPLPNVELGHAGRPLMDYPALAANLGAHSNHMGTDLGLCHGAHPSGGDVAVGHGSMTELLLGDDPLLPQLSQLLEGIPQTDAADAAPTSPHALPPLSPLLVLPSPGPSRSPHQLRPPPAPDLPPSSPSFLPGSSQRSPLPKHTTAAGSIPLVSRSTTQRALAAIAPLPHVKSTKCGAPETQPRLRAALRSAAKGVASALTRARSDACDTAPATVTPPAALEIPALDVENGGCTLGGGLHGQTLPAWPPDAFGPGPLLEDPLLMLSPDPDAFFGHMGCPLQGSRRSPCEASASGDALRCTGNVHMQSGDSLSMGPGHVTDADDGNQQSVGHGSRRRRGAEGLTVDYLEDHGLFDMPIQDAAEKLGLGITTLKKICRSGGIPRWPFRKRHSVVRLVKDLEFQKSKMQDLLMRGSLEEDIQGTSPGLPSFVLGGELPLVPQALNRAGPVIGLPSALGTELSGPDHFQL